MGKYEEEQKGQSKLQKYFSQQHYQKRDHLKTH